MPGLGGKTYAAPTVGPSDRDSRYSRTMARAFLRRTEERRRITSLVTGARNGIGGALVVTAEPGIGTPALLEADIDRDRLHADLLALIKPPGSS